MAISIPEQYQSLKTKLETIVKKTIIQYELTSSDYNPNVGSTITITCTCKNILGNPIANKTLELMMNGVSQGTSTTNANGIATWSITFGLEGVKDFYIGNSHCVVVVNGYHKIYDSGGLMWYVNTSTGISHITLNRSVSISANSHTVLKSAYSSTDSRVNYCPLTTHMIPVNTYDVFLMVSYLGEIRVYNYRSTSINNGSVQANTTFLGKSYRID